MLGSESSAMSLSPWTTAAWRGHLSLRGHEAPAWDASCAYFRCMYGHSPAFPSFALEPQERTEDVKSEMKRTSANDRIVQLLLPCSIRDRNEREIGKGGDVGSRLWSFLCGPCGSHLRSGSQFRMH